MERSAMTSQPYQLVTNFDGVQRIADEAFIPNDGGNRDWNEYQSWLAEGNTPDPAPPAPDTPPPAAIDPAIVALGARVAALEARMNMIQLSAQR
jgi:hypothetical protein